MARDVYKGTEVQSQKKIQVRLDRPLDIPSSMSQRSHILMNLYSFQLYNCLDHFYIINTVF